MAKKIIILGAGISGLASAHRLKKEGFDVHILEYKSEAGGAMATITKDGYTIDFGPNSALETTPLIKDIVDNVGLADDMVYANEEANKRYILKNNQLYPLPMGAKDFFLTKLFSLKGKFGLLGEPFVGKSDDGYYQSIAQFVERRLGQEFLDYAIDPFVSGVFAGDPYKLSVKSAFPKLYRLEEVYGGLIKGMIKGAKERKRNPEKAKSHAKMFSFKNGMQSFPKAIADKLKDNIEFNSAVEQIDKTADGYKVTYSSNGNRKEIVGDIILSTMPAYHASKIFSAFNKEFKDHADAIFYPPVVVLYLGYKKDQIEQPLDGFGYLIPGKEKKNFLGAIWSSVIFPYRAPEGEAAFTIFIGGAKKPDLFQTDINTIINTAIKEFSEIMNIQGEPVLKEYRAWEKAIPQYNLGHIEHERFFERFETENPGIFLSGNYRGGISVGDCIKNSEITVNKIKDFAADKTQS